MLSTFFTLSSVSKKSVVVVRIIHFFLTSFVTLGLALQQ